MTEFPVLFPVRHPDFATRTPSAFAIAERFWERVKKTEDCWEWTGLMQSKGYGWMEFGLKQVMGRKRKYVVRAHRLSWMLHYGEIPYGLLVCHKCDNRKCVRPDHLFIGTAKDNFDDAVAKGRIPKGGNTIQIRSGRPKKPRQTSGQLFC